MVEPSTRNRDRDEQIVQALRDGKLHREIADTFGISASNVCVISKKNGIHRPKASKRNTPLTAARLREVLQYDKLTGQFVWLRNNKCNLVGTAAGHVSEWHGYVEICVDGRPYKAHRLAWLHVYGAWPSRNLDHKDTIRHHNWIDNLREATRAQNSANKGANPNNASGFKGVVYARHARRWRARIHVDGRQISLGYFSTPEEANAAYALAASKHFGEFARAS